MRTMSLAALLGISILAAGCETLPAPNMIPNIRPFRTGVNVLGLETVEDEPYCEGSFSTDRLNDLLVRGLREAALFKSVDHIPSISLLEPGIILIKGRINKFRKEGRGKVVYAADISFEASYPSKGEILWTGRIAKKSKPVPVDPIAAAAKATELCSEMTYILMADFRYKLSAGLEKRRALLELP